jgi:hypothetical protein
MSSHPMSPLDLVRCDVIESKDNNANENDLNIFILSFSLDRSERAGFKHSITGSTVYLKGSDSFNGQQVGSA